MTYVYLASPYSHPNPEVRETRFKAAEAATVHLLKKRIWTYSPIVHCHALAKEYKLPGDFAFWQDYNETMLAAARELIVLNIHGWNESIGVKAEIAFAEKLGLAVSLFMAPGSVPVVGAPT